MTDQEPKTSSTGSSDAFKTFTEQVNVAGNEVVKRVQELIAEGNVRRVIIKEPNGRILLEIPLTLGAVAGVGLVSFAPVLAAIGAIAALVAKVNIVIERYENPADAAKDQQSHVIDVTPTDKPSQ
ncbi:MAG TPA: DUF4342 domain-containing protein [Aggregatilineales bacterium]|nr:DUF4342 domain-containing protein [Aggregatilineales bacterium]